MTDDTPSGTEGEASPDEDGRASDSGSTSERGEDTPHEHGDGPSNGPGEEPSREPAGGTPRESDEGPVTDEPDAGERPAMGAPPGDQAPLPGNPMAGVGPEPGDDQPEGDRPASHDATAGESAAPPEATGDSPGAAGDDERPPSTPGDFVPEDVRKYERFKKMDGSRYDRVNEFLRDRTYVTAREWAIARLCADFRTETGVEMTKIGENLPRLVPFMNDTYTPQAVNQARHSFEEKVRKSGATFLYGAMSGFFTAEQLDDVMYEITEVAKFLLEVEGVDLSVEEELEAEDRILTVMREVREQSEQLRHEGATCPECGHEIGAEGDD